ncbi:MAG: hypothetical protein H0T51_25225 [Pirellulales bacterium]|nr:hypothetical protein [Pirellulales bacterium]
MSDVVTLESIFFAALEKQPGADRCAFLDDACAVADRSAKTKEESYDNIPESPSWGLVGYAARACCRSPHDTQKKEESHDETIDSNW